MSMLNRRRKNMLDYFFLSYKKDDSYFWNHLFCFMIIYDYIYYHLYEPTSKSRKINSRESTLLYLTTILFFITSPFILIFINLYLNMQNHN